MPRMATDSEFRAYFYIEKVLADLKHIAFNLRHIPRP